MLQKYDQRNENILVNINGTLLPRSEAKVSVFDSSVQGGDAVWEGLRVYDGKVFCLTEHIHRLHNSALSLSFQSVPSLEEIKKEVFKTLVVNKLVDEAHIRLTLTRGIKITSGMDPRLNQSGCTLIVLAEYKPPVYPETISLITAKTRRNHPYCLDSRIHHNNLLNNILAKIEANEAKADDAIMLDMDGFVSETNATNLFLVKNGTLKTPALGSCLPGITRSVVLKLAREANIPSEESRLTIQDFLTADEVFTTGTMGELTCVDSIDSIKIIDRGQRDILKTLKNKFRKYVNVHSETIA